MKSRSILRILLLSVVLLLSGACGNQSGTNGDDISGDPSQYESNNQDKDDGLRVCTGLGGPLRTSPPPKVELSKEQKNQFKEGLKKFLNEQFFKSIGATQPFDFKDDKGKKITLEQLHDKLTQNPNMTFEYLAHIDIPNAPSQKRYKKETAAHFAVRSNNMILLNHLIDNPNTNINFKDARHGTILNRLIPRSEDKPVNMEVIKKLLKRPEIDLTTQNIINEDPLSASIRIWNGELFHLILDHPNVDVNVQYQGMTPLHLLAGSFFDEPSKGSFNGREAMKKLLEKPGINVSPQYHKSKLTPLHLTATPKKDNTVTQEEIKESEERAKLLLKYGARKDLKNKKGLTSAELARQNGYPGLAAIIENWPNG